MLEVLELPGDEWEAGEARQEAVAGDPQEAAGGRGARHRAPHPLPARTAGHHLGNLTPSLETSLSRTDVCAVFGRAPTLLPW